jgi:predicted phage baseplate assembly protein
MTLTPLQLDDLTWDDMVAAIRRRIPAESAGNWTLHAPVDPGITLLELFAYLVEQRLYWLDQVPDAFVVAVLRLLGLDGPLPAVPAATVLQITADPAKPAVLTVPAGTGFTRDPRGAVVFTLDDPVTVLPVSSLTLQAGGQDRTADLLAGRGVDLLPADGGPGEALISLHLAAQVPGGQLSLLLDLATAGTPTGPAQAIAPAWSPDRTDDVPPPAVLTWAYADGSPVPIDAAQVQDGTQGLRRSGVVRLPVPASWRAGPGVRTLRLSTTQATFAAPPRLQQLQANVATARHRQEFSHAAGDGLDGQVSQWLPLPGQHLDLPGASGLLLDASLTLCERDGQEYPWTPVTDFVFSGREDRVFVIDRAAGALRFGDGRTGRIPVPDPSQPGTALTAATWTLGAGAGGNGGTTANWRGIGDAAGAAAANVVPAADGAEPETIAQARARAGAVLQEVHRAVTAADHETIAQQAPGVAVARAHAAVGDHPGYPCTLVPGAVSVYVVPVAPRGDADWDLPDFVPAPRPDPGVLSQVCAALGAARLLGEELFVRAPRYRAVRLRIAITGTPRDPAAVRSRVQDAARLYLDPLTGGDQAAGWPFGAPVRPSALLRVAQQAAGHDGTVSSVAIALDEGTSWEDCRDVAIRPNELVALFALADVTVRFSSGSGTGPSGGLQ